jgi:pre-mRNA-splicing factor 18
MDVLIAEIARKKQQLEEKAVLAQNKKYFRRGDLAAKEAEEYWKKHKRLKTDAAADTSNLSDDGRDSPALSDADDSGKRKSLQLPRKEVVKRLRERGEPIRLFGETDYEAFQRLKKLEILEPEVQGFNNDFKEAMDQVDQDYLKEILKSTGSGHLDTTDVKVRDDGTTYEGVLKLAENLGKGDRNIDCEIILKYLKLVLNAWGDELNSRPEEQKRSIKGKLACATHMQTVSYIKPLFRSLKRRDITEDILDCLVEIVGHLLKRNYLKANDAYLEMAIGNAPWPIGVTMVGIHARTGREKIFARNVAHVLNDETQRKYIQAVKRLMTQAQKFYPTDPSFSVNFEPIVGRSDAGSSF